MKAPDTAVSGGRLRPSPAGDIGPVDSVLVSVGSAGDLIVPELLFRVPTGFLKLRHTVDRIDSQTEPIDFVIHRQFHGRVDVAFFLVSADVKRRVVPSPVSQSVDQPGVPVEIEDDWLIGCEERIEVAIRQTVRVFGVRLQLEQVDDVDEADFDVGELVS